MLVLNTQLDTISISIFISLQAKFLAVLIIIPWALDFAVHDYVLMPFLDR
jgi:hypothetical protein